MAANRLMSMYREELAELLERAAAGEDVADLVAEAIDADLEARADSRAAEAEDDRDDKYVYGCGEYDTVDSRGRPLRPAVNDAGEPWWM